MDRGEERPLVGIRLQSLVHEGSVVVAAWPVLKGQRDEVPEAPAWHRVLVREKPVV